MELNEFKTRLLEEFDSAITNQVFQFIESDRDLMHDYLNTVSTNGLKTVNSEIAKAVKKHYGLKNCEIKNKMPQSKLIQSYEVFEM